MIDREKQRLPWFAVVIIAALICAAGLLIGRLIARPQASALQDVTLLPCTSSQTIDVLAKGVVYSDGTSLRARRASDLELRHRRQLLVFGGRKLCRWLVR